MEAFAATSAIRKLFGMLSSFGNERISLLLGLEDQMKKLQKDLAMVDLVLKDAEEKQRADVYVLKWLQDLKDFAYDVEDILDEVQTEAAIDPRVMCPDDATATKKSTTLQAVIGTKRSKMLRRCGHILGNCFCPRSSSQSTDIISASSSSKQSPTIIRLNIADRINVLMKTFDDLLERKKTLNLIILPNHPTGGQESQKTSKRPQMGSIDAVGHKTFGREEEKNILIEKLTKTDKGSQRSNVSILSIVGVGGIGKSTLARWVYNDPTVGRHLKPTKWLSVGENFDPVIIIKQLLGKGTEESNVNIQLNDLQEELKRECESWQKFLIVLDDVWNEEGEKWDKLWEAISHGPAGSVVLITCRSEKVVKATGSIPTIALKRLGDHDCLSILMKHAFPDGSFEMHPKLIEAGKQIVQHLDGLPLAAKVVGGALLNNLDEGEWIKYMKEKPRQIKDRKGEIMDSLMWSYNRLPPYLRQCFGYSSLLYKDRRFFKKELTFKWIAVGLIQHEDNGEVEGTADVYFNDLVERCFFERYDFDEFMIHDLIHDLAMLVSSHECINLKENPNKSHKYKVNEHVRHLVVGFDSEFEFEGIEEYQKLRTLIIGTRVRDIIMKLKYIRVLEIDLGGLNLEGIEEYKKLGPVSHLKHLRYLKVARPANLPETLGDMVNLQYLIVEEVRSFRLRNMGRLVNLRYIGKGIEVGTEDGYRIEELGGLQELRGRLAIYNLEVVRSKEEAIKSRINDKKHVKTLELYWHKEFRDEPVLEGLRPNDKRRDLHPEGELVAEGLRPNENIQEIVIDGYGGTRFPKWTSDASIMCNLKSMTLTHCHALEIVPTAGNLPTLKTLSLSDMDGIRTIGHEFYGVRNENKTASFAALEILEFFHMKNWKEWVGEGLHFPSLRVLSIVGCENLSAFPSLSGLTNLEDLKISYCPAVPKLLLSMIPDGKNVASATPLLPVLKVLEIDSVPLFDQIFGSGNAFCSASKLEKVELGFSRDSGDDCWGDDNDDREKGSNWSLFTSLREMHFIYCSKLHYLPPHLHRLPCLKSLHIQGCHQIKALPSNGIPNSLQDFYIDPRFERCPLVKRCQQDTGADWPKISHVPRVVWSYI